VQILVVDLHVRLLPEFIDAEELGRLHVERKDYVVLNKLDYDVVHDYADVAQDFGDYALDVGGGHLLLRLLAGVEGGRLQVWTGGDV